MTLAKAAFNSKLLNFDRIYKGIESWVNKLSGTKSSLK